jgi:choline dehydrogenase-like flavoprotein
MLVDARRADIREPVRCDVCVVGGGPAGISLALELASAARHVCLLESGGLRHDRRAQALLAGDAVGCAYPELAETRCARLGGATNVWAGWCRPLDAMDFERRDWVPDSGWPISRDELLPFYRRAQELCGLGNFEYDARAWVARAGVAGLPLRGHDFEPAIFHARALNFGIEYRAALERNPDLAVLLHASALKLESSGGGDRVARVRAGTLSGRRFDVEARHFVLAAGGIENARLLLLSGATPGGSIGNDHGLVGRYFMEHGFVNAGSFEASDPRRSMAFHFPFAADPARHAWTVRSVLALGAEAQRTRRLQNGAIFFHPAYEAHDAFDSAEVQAMLELGNQLRGRAVPGRLGRRAATAIRSPRKLLAAAWRRISTRPGPQRRWRTRALFECAPDRNNRVTLSDDRDAFGRPLARLEWRPGERDIESARAMHALFDASLRDAGLGRFVARFPPDAAAWREGVEAGKHHLGSTRMHGDPRQGVVDADARVHGTANLYVAGSSVFPAGGYANPTLTLLALALRLAGHLRIAS